MGTSTGEDGNCQLHLDLQPKESQGAQGFQGCLPGSKRRSCGRLQPWRGPLDQVWPARGTSVEAVGQHLHSLTKLPDTAILSVSWGGGTAVLQGSSEVYHCAFGGSLHSGETEAPQAIEPGAPSLCPGGLLHPLGTPLDEFSRSLPIKILLFPSLVSLDSREMRDPWGHQGPLVWR